MVSKRVAALSLGLSVLSACGSRNESSLSSAGADPLKRYDESAFAAVERNIYYGGLTSPFLPLPREADRGILVYRNGEVSRDVRTARRLASILGQDITGFENLDAAEKNVQEIVRFYREQFGRNSHDDNGTEINVSVDVARNVEVQPGIADNAAWIPEKNLFYFGAGQTYFKPFAQGTDVVGHEFTHAVVTATTNLEYAGQSGALNEHFADVFGEMFQAYTEGQDPNFKIGESVMKNTDLPLRDMLEPAKGLSAQPGSMSEIPSDLADGCVPDESNDQCGVHSLSGIPNRFAAMTIRDLGWLKVRDIFYNAMTTDLSSTASFADYAAAILAECHGALSDSDCAVVKGNLNTVGL
jgi:Zn-dependent metalloprotease